MAPRFAGVVLAGGASRRMGADKAFTEVDGRPMVMVAVDALVEGGALAVQVIGGDTDRLVASGLQAVPDRWPGEGPLGGVIQAIEWAQELAVDHVMVLACDLPRASPATVRALVDLASGSPGSILVPVVEGRAQWLHACWSTRVLGALQEAFVGGERAPHRALEGLSLLEVGGLEASSLADADWPSDVSRSEPGASRHGR